MIEYLFHLKFWGQIENNGLADRLIGKERDFWWKSEFPRDSFKEKIQAIAEKNNVIVCFDENEGFEVNKRTVAKMDFIVDGKRLAYEYDFGFGYSGDGAHYMFHDGNYSCDCNRSLFLKEAGHDIEELSCGDKIEIENFKVELIK